MIPPTCISNLNNDNKKIGSKFFFEISVVLKIVKLSVFLLHWIMILKVKNQIDWTFNIFCEGLFLFVRFRVKNLRGH